jgi:hypothetical protein
MPGPNGVLKEGVIAGIIGAMTVAIWFLLVDTISTHPFYTPNMLGAGVFSILGGAALPGMFWNVAVYTVFHFVAFCAAGTLLAWIFHRAETEPSVLVIFVLLFIIFELGSVGLVTMLAEAGMKALAWYQIAAGNVLASVSMGWYLWKAHPALRAELENAIEGEG